MADDLEMPTDKSLTTLTDTGCSKTTEQTQTMDLTTELGYNHYKMCGYIVEHILMINSDYGGCGRNCT